MRTEARAPAEGLARGQAQMEPKLVWRMKLEPMPRRRRSTRSRGCTRRIRRLLGLLFFFDDDCCYYFHLDCPLFVHDGCCSCCCARVPTSVRGVPQADTTTRPAF